MSSPNPPSVGDPAPELDLPALNAERVTLPDEPGRPVIISFLRHAGWLICRSHLVKMHDRKDRIVELGADVIFVACDEPSEVRDKLVADVDLAFPVAYDPERTAYDAWGLHRAPWWRIWLDPAVWLRYARLLLSGERLRGGGADTLQLGGDFIVAPDGSIAYARPQRRDDRPPVGELLREVERLTSRG